MKKNYFILVTTALIFYGTSWGQNTSYGGLIEPGATSGTAGTFNSFFGHEAGLSNTGSWNTFIGYEAGLNNTGIYNTFIGHRSGYDNTTATENTFVGYQSGNTTTTGDSNAFIGSRSGSNNTIGEDNTFVGYHSGHDNIDGGDNTFIGSRSGSNNTTGNNNTFIGERSGYLNQTGSYNVFLGNEAGLNETGSNLLYIDNSDTSEPLIWGNFTDGSEQLRFNGIVGIGNLPQDDALTRILVADPVGNINYREVSSLEADLHSTPSYPASAGDGVNNNSFFGDLAGAITTGADNTLVGFQSGLNNTTGYENSSLGSRTLENNTTGARNTANGVFTLFGNTSGNENTAVGYAALGFNSTGHGNTATGYQTLLNNGGNFNTADGYQSLFNNTTGSNNTAMGHSALIGNTTGSNNVAIGNDAATVNQTGMENIAIGFNSGATAGNTGLNTTIAIGSSASVGADNAIAIGNVASAAHANSIAIGNNATTTLDNQLMIGNAYITDITAVAEIQTMSDGRFKKGIEEDVPGLAFIEKLRPVSYELDRNKLHTFLTGKAPQEMNTTFSDARHNGFIAQEVAQITEENDYAFSGVKKPANENDTYAIRYAQFVVPLVKSVQELSALVETQKEMLETQQQEIETLKAMVYGNGDASNSTTSAKEATILTKGFSLAQNIPNPFNETTTIIAEVPQTVSEAKIVIYSLNGIELQSYPLAKRGKTSVEIKGGSLQSGMYLYALLADGQLIDTKKMILTK